MNLVIVTGLACGLIGGAVLSRSHRAIYRAATHIVAGYPKVLAHLSAKRHDGRFGFAFLAIGLSTQAFAAAGFSAPLSLWRYPAYSIIAALVLYCGSRLVASRRVRTARRHPSNAATQARSPYETRRTVRLRDAARLESANLDAIERARDPRDTGVVYLARDCDRRWWSEKFGVSVEVLKAAVRYAGPMVKDIEQHLAGSGSRGGALA